MITATELRKKITARPRLKMDDIADFYEDLQKWLINAAEKDYTWINVFFSCTKSNFNSMDEFKGACELDLLQQLNNLGYDIRVRYFIGIKEEWIISIWLGWGDEEC